MPLYTCPHCEANVPDQAPTCIRCGQSTQAGGQQPPNLAPKKGMGTGLIVLIVLAVSIIPIVGILAVLGIYGTRKYIASAKTAEAKNTLGQIAKDAASAYEVEHLSGPTRRLCRSASSPVPANRSALIGRKYQSTGSEWRVDESADAGFACLKFEMTAPQYYQYEYIATATSFIARAHGDLNGDGVFSTFEIRGEVRDGRLLIAPSIVETNPDE